MINNKDEFRFFTKWRWQFEHIACVLRLVNRYRYCQTLLIVSYKLPTFNLKVTVVIESHKIFIELVQISKNSGNRWYRQYNNKDCFDDFRTISLLIFIISLEPSRRAAVCSVSKYICGSNPCRILGRSMYGSASVFYGRQLEIINDKQLTIPFNASVTTFCFLIS